MFWLKIDEWCKLYKNNLKIQFVLQTFSSKWMLKIIVSNVLWKYNSVFENLMKKKNDADFGLYWKWNAKIKIYKLLLNCWFSVKVCDHDSLAGLGRALSTIAMHGIFR